MKAYTHFLKVSCVTLLILTFFSTFIIPAEEITLSAVGDCIIARKISNITNPAFKKVIDIISKSDASWINVESVITDISDKYPAYRTDDLHAYSPPWTAHELSWMGFDLAGIANNHTMDFSFRGLLDTIKYLKEKDIVYGGAGKNLEEASMPVYYDSPRGRIGMVSCSATFQEGAHASLKSSLIPGRPGLNPLRVHFSIVTDKEIFKSLKKLSNDIFEYFKIPAIGRGEDKPGEARILGVEYGFKEGKSLKFEAVCNKPDILRVVESVKIAKNNSHIVIASLHAHEIYPDTHKPFPYLEEFAHAVIDAGADIVVSSGPHQLSSIEIYKGKPVFYSLGNFMFHFHNHRSFPLEMFDAYPVRGNPKDSTSMTSVLSQSYFKNHLYWWSIIPQVTFNEDGEVVEIKVFPIYLGKGKTLYDKGTPVLADDETSEKIISHLQNISKDYGTEIFISQGTWKIRIK